MATISDYTGQIGVMLRGHFYLLEDALEQQTKQIEQNGKSIVDFTLELNKVKMDMDLMAHSRDQPSPQRRRQPITETKGFLKIDTYTGGQSVFRQWKHQ
eukprot:8387177-Heterocapsa_arctica.AAC.1